MAFILSLEARPDAIFHACRYLSLSTAISTVDTYLAGTPQLPSAPSGLIEYLEVDAAWGTWRPGDPAAPGLTKNQLPPGRG